MKRRFALIIAISVLCGCRNQSPPGNDPFFGRTAVPPPPTGSATGRLPDPCYRGTPAATAPLAPIPQVQQPGVTLPAPAAGGATRYDPPGGSFNYRGASSGQGSPLSQPEKWMPQTASSDNTPSRIKIIEPANKAHPAGGASEIAAAAAGAQTNAAANAKVANAADAAAKPPTTDIASASANFARAASDASGGPLSGRPRVVQDLQPRPQPAGSGSTSADSRWSITPATGGLQRAAVTPKSVDIMELPPAGSSTSSGGAASPSAGSGFRLVSGSDTPGEPSGVIAAVGSAPTDTVQDHANVAAGR